jgi:hypothetical protein
MIRLSPVARPVELTDDLIQKLTHAFIANPKKQRVWDKLYIKKALLEMSNDKCCYCECKVTEESKYLEVEHFRYKHKYKNEVLTWSNLLPSCKRCNGTKGDHDVVFEPIIHPVNMTPKDHLYLEAYRFYGKDSIGKSTIKILDLNDRERLQQKRFQIGSEIKRKLDEIDEDWKEILENSNLSERSTKKLAQRLRRIMLQGLPKEEYAATVASEILREDAYFFIKNNLIDLNLWDTDFQHLENELQNIALDPKPKPQ